MDTDTIFIVFLVVFTLAIAFSLYSRRSNRRMVDRHRTDTQRPPGASGPAEVDHDQGEHAPLQRGTR